MSLVRADKKIPAGILAILLGGFGVHKFFLGYPRAGVAMLATHAVGWLCVTIGFLGLHFIGTAILTLLYIVAFIEGIIYLTTSNSDFYRRYEIGRRPWF